MSSQNKDTGKIGEDFAVELLKRNKYKIVERNFLIRGGEIDIIAIDSSDNVQALVFIEVKTRNSNEFGDPLEAITSWKLNSIIKTAEFYKSLYPKLPELLRIDAVSVILENNKVKSYEIIKNITS